MFISVTRLRLRSLYLVPRFLSWARQTNLQVRSARGFQQGAVLMAGPKTFWTLTVWADEACMREYRSTGAHREVMPKLALWCDEASVAHWFDDSAVLPDWKSAHARMQERGRRSPVNHPSAAQRAEPWRVPPPRWRIGVPLEPSDG